LPPARPGGALYSIEITDVQHGMLLAYCLLAKNFSLARERMDALFMCGILLMEEQIGCHQHDLTIKERI
jgi:hypothetical protein